MSHPSILKKSGLPVTIAVLFFSLLLMACPENIESPATGELELTLILSGDAGGVPVLEYASFDSSTSTFSIDVSSQLVSIVIEMESDISGASVSINGTPLSVGLKVTIPLSFGPNTIEVKITPNSGDPVSYTLKITRAEPPVLSDNADLSNLELSEGYLTPVFDSATSVYDSSVSSDTASVTVTPTASDSAAIVTVNGIEVNSGEASSDVSLSAGYNDIDIIVTAEDGETSNTYTVTVERRSAADTTAPVITLNGDDPMTIAYGSVFTDPGATVEDNIDGSWTVYSDDEVDTSSAGDYSLAYNAADLDGNEADEVTRMVTVEEKPPLETPDLYYYWDSTEGYMHQHMTADDYTVVLYDGSGIDSGYYLEYDNGLNTGLVYSDAEGLYYFAEWTEPVDGLCYLSYSIGYESADDAAAATADDVTLTCYTSVDVIPPVITLIGDASMSVESGGDFSDPGATVRDWDESDNYTVYASDDDGFDIDTPGEYTFTYTADDGVISAEPQTRTVTVTGTDPLELTDIYRWESVYEDDYIHIELTDIDYSVFNQDAVEVDYGDVVEYDNDAKQVIIYSEPQDAYYRIEWADAVAGVFETYQFGTFSTLEEARTDTTGEASFTAYTEPQYVPPVLVLNGSSSVTLGVGEAFVDPQAMVKDWGVEEISIDASNYGGLNTSSAASGTYTITYTHTDGDDNDAEQKTREVVVGSGAAEIIIQ